MVEYYDEFQIGEYVNGEPIYIRVEEINTTILTLGEETHVEIFGTIK